MSSRRPYNFLHSWALLSFALIRKRGRDFLSFLQEEPTHPLFCPFYLFPRKWARRALSFPSSPMAPRLRKAQRRRRRSPFHFALSLSSSPPSVGAEREREEKDVQLWVCLLLPLLQGEHSRLRFACFFLCHRCVVPPKGLSPPPFSFALFAEVSSLLSPAAGRCSQEEQAHGCFGGD